MVGETRLDTSQQQDVSNPICRGKIEAGGRVLAQPKNQNTGSMVRLEPHVDAGVSLTAQEHEPLAPTTGRSNIQLQQSRLAPI